MHLFRYIFLNSSRQRNTTFIFSELLYLRFMSLSVHLCVLYFVIPPRGRTGIPPSPKMFLHVSAPNSHCLFILLRSFRFAVRIRSNGTSIRGIWAMLCDRPVHKTAIFPLARVRGSHSPRLKNSRPALWSSLALILYDNSWKLCVALFRYPGDSNRERNRPSTFFLSLVITDHQTYDVASRRE